MTNQSLNKAKNASKMSDFVASMDARVENKKNELITLKEKLTTQKDMPLHKRQELEKKIKNAEDYIENFESADREKMLAADKKARAAIDYEINHTYYTSSKFFKNTASAAGNKGVKMGVRQALGLVFAEVWFELKTQIPKIYEHCKTSFNFQEFLSHIKETLANIFIRLKERFSDLLTQFKEGFLGGILSSLSTTFINIFKTTTSLVGKLIREMWNSLVQVGKLLFFNPQNLKKGDLIKEVFKLLSAGVSIAVGAIVNNYLSTILVIPFGEEISVFISGMLSGILTLGFTYFLEYSEIANKIWTFLNSLKSKYEQMKDAMIKINTELDRYLEELTKIEFNLNANELTQFALTLNSINDELELNTFLKKEIQSRNITLPYDINEEGAFKKMLLKKRHECSQK
ncbi:cobalamin adenosyltransferase [Pelistega sp. NLN82]|uniref:Cobalamin adenosyltransferase n=1 Tax=Pelistega ratti TaxID=2652177 RepID=A0A6L9Y8W1_9BURK|nr:cobalamin adenosyltransferase [Pelistega ratti]NEN76317.1 cobalamin adenosyltransferase [Pelistega ratti]